MSLYRSITLLMTILLTLNKVGAADQTTFVPMATDDMALSIQQNTVVASSAQDFHLIPSPEVNKYVFITILGNPVLLQSLTLEDQEIVSTLPSHEDRRFKEPAYSRLKSACELTTANADTMDVSHIARLHSTVEKSNAEALIAHYANILSRLSSQGLAVLQSVYDDLKGSQRIAHTEVDYDTLSKTQPDYVRALYQRVCASALAWQPSFYSESLAGNIGIAN